MMKTTATDITIGQTIKVAGHAGMWMTVESIEATPKTVSFRGSIFDATGEYDHKLTISSRPATKIATK